MKEFNNIKLAFYDIDGVLSIPRYNVNGLIKCGGNTEWWEDYCKDNSNPYEFCGVPNKIYNNLKIMKDLGIELYVLSVETNLDAKRGKIKFIEDKYSEFFDEKHIIFVNSDTEKLNIIKNKASNKKVSLENIYFVDDTFSLVLAASTMGINTIHISWFLEERL